MATPWMTRAAASEIIDDALNATPGLTMGELIRRVWGAEYDQDQANMVRFIVLSWERMGGIRRRGDQIFLAREAA
ncbi:MAG: hypothetical protein KMY53_16080 [Desulfarculus sp.]|nr:hypothetical protein [Pseudomonadota bacterium]MBV1715466.1 hypothetical protein [Desulfarculus sp.]MBU4576228.1 hypothetical protein [Pseudomonadota bacterium]MBU4599266.1 hypothetical protein [Pseudomonadota bacterium]MBV1739687.1 hypothetical protein [Desulfarculus sp.]